MAAEHVLSDQSLMLILGIAFFATQIVYFFISKSSTNRVIDKLVEIMKDLSPHFERSRRAEAMIEKLADQHNVLDEDNRPAWYYPQSMGTVQKELLSLALETSKILLQISKSQEDVRQAMHDFNQMIEQKLTIHSDTCKQQFNDLDKKIL